MKLFSLHIYALSFLLLFNINCFSQNDDQKEEMSEKENFNINKVVEIEEEEERTDVPFAVVEDVPVYPGCEGLESNSGRKKCMSDKVSSFVNKNFVIPEEDVSSKEGGVKRIYTSFKIDSNGSVSNIKTRAHNGSLKLEEEAVRVLKLLPKMEPGKQRGKVVGVMYSLPIVYRTGGKGKEKK